MFQLPSFLMSPGMQKRIDESNRLSKERRLKACVPWDPLMPWAKEMNLKADTYRATNLCPEVKAKNGANPNQVEKGQYEDSPSGDWRYTVNIVPSGAPLTTWRGSQMGTVMFDGPVEIPALYSREKWGKKVDYEKKPWMSITPAEIMSMRTGLRFARGHTVVAGLGLGHLLMEVTKKRSVKKVTLVEISQELIDWLYPRIKPHLKMDVDVIVGDAKHTIPGLEADAALVDIDESYGNNTFSAPWQHIPSRWVWGSAPVGSRDGYFC
jgi:hypothetical protein